MLKKCLQLVTYRKWCAWVVLGLAAATIECYQNVTAKKLLTNVKYRRIFVHHFATLHFCIDAFYVQNSFSSYG